MAEITYQVRLKNIAGAQIATFVGRRRGLPGGLWGFNYDKRLRTPGQFTVRIDGNDERIDLFALDCQVEFWRRDTRAGLDWYLDFEGFHRSWEFSQDQDGRDVFVSRGRGYNDLLAAEPIRYYTGSDYCCKDGSAETVAKAYVDENVGPAATSPPRVSSGVMPGLTIEADAGTGANWDDCRSGNLLDALVELADTGPGDFMVVGTGPAAFEFRWRDVRWGLDKTQGNGARPPLTFGPAYRNATNLRYNYSRLDEANVVYVLGQDAGAARAVEVVTSGAETDSPWARRAVSRDARDAEDDMLEARGYATLYEQRAKRTMRFDARQTVACRYGRDWDMGDLITVEFRAMTFDQKITGAHVAMSSDGVETVQPEIEDPWM